VCKAAYSGAGCSPTNPHLCEVTLAGAPILLVILSSRSKVCKLVNRAARPFATCHGRGKPLITHAAAFCGPTVSQLLLLLCAGLWPCSALARRLCCCRHHEVKCLGRFRSLDGRAGPDRGPTRNRQRQLEGVESWEVQPQHRSHKDSKVFGEWFANVPVFLRYKRSCLPACMFELNPCWLNPSLGFRKQYIRSTCSHRYIFTLQNTFSSRCGFVLF
jgi:hypothetical protein